MEWNILKTEFKLYKNNKEKNRQSKASQTLYETAESQCFSGSLSITAAEQRKRIKAVVEFCQSQLSSWSACLLWKFFGKLTFGVSMKMLAGYSKQSERETTHLVLAASVEHSLRYLSIPLQWPFTALSGGEALVNRTFTQMQGVRRLVLSWMAPRSTLE